MAGSLLIFGNTQNARQIYSLRYIEKKINKKLNWNYMYNFADIKIVEPIEGKKSIGIAQAKEVVTFLNEKPLAHDIKIALIVRADLLTIEAQNALLKILEEPPEYGLIILLCRSEGDLLPTVSSRCKKIKCFLSEEESPEHKKAAIEQLSVAKMISLPIGNRLDWAEETSKEEREDVLGVLYDWLEEGRVMLQQPTVTAKQLSNVLEKLAQTINDLENTNVNTRLCLENFIVSF